MDKVERYADIIKQILAEDAQIKPAYGEIEPLLIFDDTRGSYQLMYVGWQKRRRVHGSVYHLRLHNDKVYVEEDTTDQPIALSLLEAGIPKEDIVLAFHHPTKREYTDFAVA
ncbi:MAG: XisI protein [Caldilineaceae bacterium]